MGIYYSMTAGYGITIDADNIDQIGKLLNIEDDWPDTVLNELFTELNLHQSLTYGYEFDQMTGRGNPGAWIARSEDVVSGELRSDFEAGIRTFENVYAGSWFSPLLNWLDENEIEYKIGFFVGMSIL